MMRNAAQITLLLLALPLTTLAQVDTSEWLCESCPFEDGYRSDYEVGASYVSDEDLRSGNATGYDTDGAFLNVDGDGIYASDGYRLSWRIEDLGLDSRLVSIDAGKQGQYGFHVAYSELPQRVFDSTQTIFESSSGTLTLPSSWVAAGTTSGFSALGSSLQSQTIESDRQTAEFGARWIASDAIELFADYTRRSRDGIDIKSGGGFTQASLLPRRIDYTTDLADVGIRFRSENGNLTLAYFGSSFMNKNLALSWQTPFTTAAGATQLAVAEEPDNNFQQLSLSGAYRADFWHAVLAFSVAAGRGEQHDALLDYTTNPNIVTASLPRNSLNGEVESSNYALTFTARPASRVRLRLSYRFDERDNTTAISDWARVITDVFPSGELEQNVAYSFKRSRLSGSADVKVFDSLRVSAGYDRNELDRDFQEVAEQTEDAGWGQLRWRPAAWLELRARGGASTRDINRYDETVAIGYGQNPLLRKYNLAYRYREFGELSASVSPQAKPISLSATVYSAEDSYSESKLGLTDSEELRYTVDLSWDMSESATSYLVFGSESVEAEQLGSASFAVADWRAAHDDNFDHWGVGLRWRQPDGKVDLRLDYSMGEGDTRIVVEDNGLGSALPQLLSSLDSLRAEAAYRWSDKLDLTFDLRYESFSSDDWALADVAPDTLPTVLTLGATPYDYDVWALGIGFRYYLGGRGLQLVN